MNWQDKIKIKLFNLPPQSFSSAQQTTQPAEDAGVTPDSFLWGLDKALDNLKLQKKDC